jgi:hypothetical protein
MRARRPFIPLAFAAIETLSLNYVCFGSAAGSLTGNKRRPSRIRYSQMGSVANQGFECKEVRRISDAYVDDELAPSLKSRSISHLRICGDCAWLIQQKLRLKTSVRRAVHSTKAPRSLRDEVANILLRHLE